MSTSNRSRRCAFSRTMLSIQEERRRARAARDGGDVVDARGRIEHEIARRQLHPLRAVRVLDDEFAAVVVAGRRQEQRRRQVGAEATAACRVHADRAVDVAAERHAFAVAVEERRKDLPRQRGREERRVSRERGEVVSPHSRAASESSGSCYGLHGG